MKILFAIQGTGNGHLSRARDILPHLQAYGEVDILISGTQVDVSLSQEIKYRKKGISFIFGKKGGVDYWETFKRLDPLHFIKDVLSLPLKQYDLIINDFEPVSAWAARLRGRKVIALSHQCSFLSEHTPRPQLKDAFAERLFRYYAPCSIPVGFHFKPYDHFIHTPIIRKEIRELKPERLGHYTVYLPAYDDKLLVKILGRFNDIHWEIFSKHILTPYQAGKIKVMPIHNEAYNLSLSQCEGLLTGGGFEAPAEALFLGKKVFVIPMKGQYEQQCNAEALKQMGVALAYDTDEFFETTLHNWLYRSDIIRVDFPDNVKEVVAKTIQLAN